MAGPLSNSLLFRSGTESRSPMDLAFVVHSELVSRKAGPPALDVLVDLFESMYFASAGFCEARIALCCFACAS